MLLKLIVVSASVLARKRNSFKKHQAYLADRGGISRTHFDMPGSQELFDSLINKEVETDWKLVGIDEEFEKDEKVVMMAIGDRFHRPGHFNKINNKSWPISSNLQLPVSLTLIEKSGGLPFCKSVSPVQVQCRELYDLMARRRAACTKLLLDYYNPKRKWKLKAYHKARMKYCRKVVKLRNPFVWCKKNCHDQFCEQKKDQCFCKGSELKKFGKFFTE